MRDFWRELGGRFWWGCCFSHKQIGGGEGGVGKGRKNDERVAFVGATGFQFRPDVALGVGCEVGAGPGDRGGAAGVDDSAGAVGIEGDDAVDTAWDVGAVLFGVADAEFGGVLVAWPSAPGAADGLLAGGFKVVEQGGECFAEPFGTGGGFEFDHPAASQVGFLPDLAWWVDKFPEGDGFAVGGLGYLDGASWPARVLDGEVVGGLGGAVVMLDDGHAQVVLDHLAGPFFVWAEFVHVVSRLSDGSSKGAALLRWRSQCNLQFVTHRFPNAVTRGSLLFRDFGNCAFAYLAMRCDRHRPLCLLRLTHQTGHPSPAPWPLDSHRHRPRTTTESHADHLSIRAT